MPIFGLPKVLETVINDLLQDSPLRSYKIAGYGELCTVVLRFDNATNTGSVKPSRQSTPAVNNYRRKSPSQLRRDQARRFQHQTSIQPEKTRTTDLDLELIDNFSDQQQMKNTEEADSLISETTFDPTRRDVSLSTMMSCEGKTKQHADDVDNSQHMAVNNCDETSPAHLSAILFDHVNKTAVSVKSHEKNKTTSTLIEHDGSSQENQSLRSRSTSISSLSSVTSNFSRIINQDSSIDKEVKSAKSDPQLPVLMKMQGSAHIRRYIANLDQKSCQIISQEDRNTEIIKSYYIESEGGSKSNIIFVETDDFILKYYTDSKDIDRIAVKGHDHSFTRSLMEFVFNYPDYTQTMQADHEDDWKNITASIPYLKRLVREIHGSSSDME